MILQFVRPARNNGSASSATDITHRVHTPDTIVKILQTSCYDCHSNHTVYPWYTNINPIGLWMNNHVNDGKRAINFSDLSTFSDKKFDHRLKDIAEECENHDMPLSSYTLIHGYAKLNDGQIKLIKDWTEAARKEVNYHP